MLIGVEVKEILKKTIIVDQDTVENAILQVTDAVHRDEILLVSEDFSEREINPSPYWKEGIVPEGEDVSFYDHLKIDEDLKCVSLKELYESGHKILKYGGEIRYTKECSIYYDLYKDEIDNEPLLCDGEAVKLIRRLPDFILVENTENHKRILFSQEEFEIAVFHAKPSWSF